VTAWKGLLQKEYHLGKKGVLISLILLAFYFLLAIGISYKYEQTPIMLVLGMVALGFHTFFMIVYLFNSLNTESKNLWLWLHNPQSAKRLLLAKLLNGLFALLVSLAFNSIFVWYAGTKALNELNQNIYWSDITKIFSIIIFHIIAYSIYLGIWLMFAWTIHHVMKRYIGKLSGLVVLLVFFIPTWGVDKITSLPFIQSFMELGKIDISFKLLNNLPKQINVDADPSLYIGNYLFYLIIIVAVFLLTSWLIDRKVEV